MRLTSALRLFGVMLTLPVASVANAQLGVDSDLVVEDTNRGGHWGLDHHDLPDGSVSIVRVTGASRLAGRAVDTQYVRQLEVDGQQFESTAVGTATFLVRRDRGGRAIAVERLRIDGHDTNLYSRRLPTGDLLMFGTARVDDVTQAAVARVDSFGRVRWSWRAPNRPPRCEHPPCAFSCMDSAVVDSGGVWVDAVFYRGALDLPSHASVQGGSARNRVTVALDPDTGTIRWARGRTGTAPVLAGGELVNAVDRGGRIILRSHDPMTGATRRPTRFRLPAELRGMVTGLHRQGDGFLLTLHHQSVISSWVVGVARDGRVRFHRPIDAFAHVETSGEVARFVEPLRTARHRAPGGGSALSATGLQITEVDSRGRETRRVTHGGHWDLGSFALTSDGSRLSGLRSDGSDSRLVLVPFDASTRSAALPPGPPSDPRAASSAVPRTSF